MWRVANTVLVAPVQEVRPCGEQVVLSRWLQCKKLDHVESRQYCIGSSSARSIDYKNSRWHSLGARSIDYMKSRQYCLGGSSARRMDYMESRCHWLNGLIGRCCTEGLLVEYNYIKHGGIILLPYFSYKLLSNSVYIYIVLLIFSLYVKAKRGRSNCTTIYNPFSLVHSKILMD